MKTFEAIGKRCSLKAHLSRRAVKLPGAKRLGFREDSPSGSFLREEASASFARAGAAAPKSPALPFTPTAMRLPTAKRLDVLWLFPIEPEKINRILEAACLAPSARNSQPWRFIVVQGRETIEALAQTGFKGPGSVVGQAPVIIVVCARASDDVTIDGKEYYLFDVGLAVENMLLAATDLGLATHLMASFNEAEMKRLLHIPDDFRVVIVTPLACPPKASYDEAAEERLGQRTRKGAEEVIYLDRWGEPA
jgi:nitroreductase